MYLFNEETNSLKFYPTLNDPLYSYQKLCIQVCPLLTWGDTAAPWDVLHKSVDFIGIAVSLINLNIDGHQPFDGKNETYWKKFFVSLVFVCLIQIL